MSRHFTLLCICTVSALLFSQPRNSKLKVKCASQLICASICARNSCPSQCQTYILTLQFYFILTACHIFSSSVVIESACCSYCYQAWNKVSEFTFIQSTYWTVWLYLAIWRSCVLLYYIFQNIVAFSIFHIPLSGC